MIIDKTTLQDLSFLQGEHAVFHRINYCTTQAGTAVLTRLVQQPPKTYEQLTDQQAAVAFWIKNQDKWTNKISNGTLVMIEKFYESAEGAMVKPNKTTLFINSIFQKLFNKDEYSFVRFSVSHLTDFLSGCAQLTQLLQLEPPTIVKTILDHFEKTLQLPLCKALIATNASAPQSALITLSYRARREIKHHITQLIDGYARLDALFAMATATLKNNWTLPNILPSNALQFRAVNLYHPLLQTPIAYNIDFSDEQNFLFLTGANMSGKSTLIRALGISAVLAHIGMGVPAQHLTISFLEGVITNMQVEDSIFKGESYFFAEVQRMKVTAQKLNHHKYHLVLMDELFKGTNVHDAYECSKAVIDGLLTQRNNLMALSTHLNELADNLYAQPSVWFRYCYTEIDTEGNYTFTYQLKEGVSKDRIGFLVLKKEGVLDLLQS